MYYSKILNIKHPIIKSNRLATSVVSMQILNHSLRANLRPRK